jgi:hypothetical protein
MPADGTRRPRVRGVQVPEDRFRLTRERFKAADHVIVTIDGLDACRHLFGLTSA